MLTARAIVVFRLLGGLAAVAAGSVVLLTDGTEEALGIALLVLGVFILAHAALDYSFQKIRQPFDAPDSVGGLREFASAFVATSGVILGLLGLFTNGDEDFSTTLKVGIVALVGDILIGTALVGLLLAGAAPSDQRAWNLIRYVFNLALWALTLGLLCVATSLLYR